MLICIVLLRRGKDRWFFTIKIQVCHYAWEAWCFTLHLVLLFKLCAQWYVYHVEKCATLSRAFLSRRTIRLDSNSTATGVTFGELCNHLAISFFNGHNSSHVLVGLAEGSLAQVFHEPAGQAWCSTKVGAGICNMFMVPAKARLLFVKDTMGSLTSTKKFSYFLG